MQEIKKNTPFWKWATVAVLGSGSAAPRFGSPISSMIGCQMGGMDPNGYGMNSTHNMGNGVAKCENNGRESMWCDWWKMAKSKSPSGMAKKCFGRVLHNVFIVWS